jgi:pimeloyl-ACP methyl ester carboxylesterase
MELLRRSFVASAVAAAVVGRSSAYAEDLQIEPVSPAALIGGPYARFATPGPFGIPDKPALVDFGPGLRGDIWLPRRPGARVIVFSHGELSVPLIYGKLLSHWASHGFAVAAPIHDDSVIEDGLRAAGGSRSWDIGKVLDDPRGWKVRAAMCSRSLDALEKMSLENNLRLDMSSPVIAGHSYGAYTAALLSGTRALSKGGNLLDVTDRRFAATILLSPQGRGVMGLTDGAWDSMTAPALMVTGHGDQDGSGQVADVKAESYALSPPGNKHLAWFSRISPALYSGNEVYSGSPEEKIFLDLLAITTAFLYGESIGDVSAVNALSGRYFDSATSGRVDMLSR